MSSSADLPYELIDIIFEFIPSNGLHVSKKYNDVLLPADSESTAVHYLIHVYRQRTGRWKHTWEHDLDYQIQQSYAPSTVAQNALSNSNEIIDKLFDKSHKKYVDNSTYIVEYLAGLYSYEMHLVDHLKYYCTDETLQEALDLSVESCSIQESIMDTWSTMMTDYLEPLIDDSDDLSRIYKFYIFREQESIKKILDGSNWYDTEDVANIIRTLFAKVDND